VSIKDVLIERACGLDVHKKNITACIITSEGKEIKTFRTHTVFIIELIDWIKDHCCTHVAMESTGVFWKPIVNLLEAEDIEFMVVNAQHIIEASHSIRGSDHYLGAQYRRIAARKGRPRAAVAVAHSIMTIAYHLLTRQEDYKDLGSDYFEKRHRDAIVKQTVRKLENLGFTVTLATSEVS
jgi:transposase